MKFLKNLTTTKRTSTLFALMNLFFMILLVIAINLSYFYLWYEDQKAESLFDMNKNYAEMTNTPSASNIDAFKNYILTKDTIILDSQSEETLVCSQWVASKIHQSEISLENLKDSYFYKDESNGKIYLVFSHNYPEIGTVKVLFDTTHYINSQLLILKISLVIILFSLIASYFLGKLFTKYTLRDLRKISNEAKTMTLENYNQIQCEWCNDDEVKILATTINQSILRIKKQSKDLKQFITDVSHEFKTPLMVINSKIDVYRKQVEKWKSKSEDLDTLLNTIKNRTKKLNNTLETLFILSRKTEWIEEVEKQNINLKDYLEQYIREYIANSDKNILVKFYFQEDIFQDIDKNIFNIIIDNLISNAIKFSKEDGIIEVWGNKKEIWIKDYGIWMDEKTAKHIWWKFYRQDTNLEGFWVWLYIVSRIVQLFQWKIDVKSKQNEWSTFIIKF